MCNTWVSGRVSNRIINRSKSAAARQAWMDAQLGRLYSDEEKRKKEVQV